ncbi:MAG: septum formation initiator family protein [Clostridiales bacterium]|nr:septum formation initiator family protein [Clostridiales bacterium]
MAKTAKKFRYSKILAVALVVAVCYCVVQVIVLRSDYKTKLASYNSIITQCEKIEEKNAKLAEIEELLESGNNDEYIERIAREEFDYVMPGERVYIDKSVTK